MNIKYEYSIFEIQIEVNNQQIYGKLYVPQKEGKHPLIIYSHELCHTQQTGISYAQVLAAHGYAVCIFDFRGGSEESASDGSPKQMSVLTEMEDLNRIIERLVTLSQIDENRVILLGASQGGVVSFLQASKVEENVQSLHSERGYKILGLILLYPAFSLQNIVHNDFKNYESITDEYHFNKWIWVGRRYAEDVWNINFPQKLKAYEKPVLIMHGDKDPIMPEQESKTIASYIPHGEYQLISGGRHGFCGESFQEAIQYILEFLREIVI